MTSIENKVWWITGASSGIGMGMVNYVLKNGGKVGILTRITKVRIYFTNMKMIY